MSASIEFMAGSEKIADVILSTDNRSKEAHLSHKRTGGDLL